MVQNFTRLYKIFISIFLLSTSTCLWAQTGSDFMMCELHTVDVREFAASLKWESPQVSARIQTRGTPAPDNIRWIDRFNDLPDYMHEFYNIYGEKVQQVLDGGINYLSDPEFDNSNTIKAGSDIYTIIRKVNKTIDFTYSTEIQPTQANLSPIVDAAINNDCSSYVSEANTFMPYLLLCMDYDYPQAFWTGKTQKWGATYECDYQTNSPGKGSINYTFYILYLLKSSDFDYRIEPFNTASTLQDGIVEYKAAIDGILSDLPNSTRYIQLRYLNEWLTKHNAYASNYNPNTAAPIVWSPMSALRGTNGTTGPVCEGYSRAFKVLCDKINIPCIIAVGEAKASKDGSTESHMWNEVKMNDGQWYAVDVTWNDPVTGAATEPKESGSENENWFLLGKNDIVATNLTFAQSHLNDYESLIADTGFDDATYGLHQAAMTGNAVKVYSLLGVNIGTFESLDQAISSLESGLYIINGRKMVVK